MSHIYRFIMSTKNRRDYLVLLLLTTGVSVTALAFHCRQNAILLYGDAVAHINIARRVFDSRTPGVFQLGTVWLPLPHLLDIPFVANGWLWRSGVGAAIPSMLAYIAGTLGVFRLVQGRASRASAWTAALVYALNPNLIYLQTTAMTEPLYLALFVWTAVYFSEFVREARVPARAGASFAGTWLERCAITLSAAMLVRYDAWFLAVFVLGGAWAVSWRTGLVAVAKRQLLNFSLLPVLAAGLWLAYNHAFYDNALEFATGPYSSHAIQQRSKTATMPTYPGENSPRDAVLYFLKLTRLNMGQDKAEYLIFASALVALLAMIYFSRRYWPWALLWIPLPFYVLSIAWGSVPIYFPDWYPFSYYNVRYGLELLPALAVFFALGCEFLSKFFSWYRVGAAAALLVFLSYYSVWQRSPICLREARVNGGTRMVFEQQLAATLKRLPAGATLMMDCSAYSGALQQAGIPFRRVLRESNPPYWEEALAQPAKSADYVVAITGDEVWFAMRRSAEGLKPVAIVGTPGRRSAVIYRRMPQ
jgi:hypothetical protein